jgi:hypothetical protein
MTVRRQGEATFANEKAALVGATRTILAGNPIYKDTLESADGSFTTSVKPSFYLMSTPMTIAFEKVGTAITVKVSTTSQAFLMGDAFGYYDRYIHDFLDELKRALH